MVLIIPAAFNLGKVMGERADTGRMTVSEAGRRGGQKVKRLIEAGERHTEAGERQTEAGERQTEAGERHRAKRKMKESKR